MGLNRRNPCFQGFSFWLNYEPSGQFVQATTEFSRSGFCTFLPNPLTSVKIKMDDELSELLCTAHRLLGQLEGMSAFLPNMTALESVMLYKETLLSCMIDGHKASVYDILDASRKPDN